MIVIEFTNGWKPIEALSLDFASNVNFDSGARRRSKPSEVSFSKRAGTNSASFILATASGKVIAGCQISVFSEDGKKLIQRWKLEDVVLTSYSKTSRTQELVTLNFWRIWRLR